MTPITHVVAVTRWNGPADPLVHPLSQLLGREPYELRTKLSGPLPVIVATVQDDSLAHAARDLLRSAGHGVVACDAHVGRVAPPIHLDDVEMPGQTLLGVADHQRVELPLAHLELIIEATLVQTEGTSAQVRTHMFPGRRGTGLVAIAQTGRRGEKVNVERVAYLVRRATDSMLVVTESETQFAGSLLRPTRRDSFRELVRLLRERAPRAGYDARLTTQKRPAVMIGHRNGMQTGVMPLQSFTTQTERASNVSGTELAAHLIALAHQLGQA